MLFLDYILLYHTNHRSVDINKRNRITRKMFFTCFNVTSFTFLPLSEQITGGVERAGGSSETKILPQSFVFHYHFCHFFRNPFRQRAEQVTEEVAVAVLLSPQPARGSTASTETRTLSYSKNYTVLVRKLHGICNDVIRYL
jgi:hypothetical protein